MVEISDLKKIPLFRELGENELEKIKALIFEKTYHKGVVLFFEGMPGEILYLVKTGSIEIFKKKENGEVRMAVLGPGEFVGEMSLIDNEPRSASARTLEDALLLVITKKVFADILAAIPQGASKILMALLKIMSQRLRETNRKFAAGS